MSQSLISRSSDLKRLAEDGYEIEVKAGLLLLKNIPHFTENKTVKYGTLVSELTLEGDVTTTPNTHVAMFAGDMPCDQEGCPLAQIHHSSGRTELGEGVVIDHTFSSKPPKGYLDFHHKMTTYESIISEPVKFIDPDATARTFKVLESQDEDSVFKYVDTASSRAGIRTISEKLRIGAVAIVGLGGTGSYILDLIAKTPVSKIHLFDGDKFGQHNAFRAPGAPSIEKLIGTPMKSEYFQDLYSEMRSDIVAHGFVDELNIDFLRKMEFVFVAVDKGAVRKTVVEKLEESNVPFIDVGMDVQNVGGSLRGTLRVTTSSDKSRDQVHSTLPLSDIDSEDEYSRNIQIADLNALNATLAVIKWKKILGFYVDLEMEQFHLPL